MTDLDEELRSWAKEWKRAGEPRGIEPAVIEREVRRRTLRLGVFAAVEFAILGAMLVFLVMFAFSTHDPWDLAMVVAFSALIFVVFGRGIGALRRTWRAHAETTRGFVDLMIVRGETRLIQTRFGWVILLVEIAVFVPWIAHTTRASSAPAIAIAYGFLASAVAIAVVTLIVTRRRALRDLNRWRALHDDVRD